MPLENEIIAGVAQGGPLALILAWFMLRAETRLDKVRESADRVETAINRLTEKIECLT